MQEGGADPAFAPYGEYPQLETFLGPVLLPSDVQWQNPPWLQWQNLQPVGWWVSCEIQAHLLSEKMWNVTLQHMQPVWKEEKTPKAQFKEKAGPGGAAVRSSYTPMPRWVSLTP